MLLAIASLAFVGTSRRLGADHAARATGLQSPPSTSEQRQSLAWPVS